MEFAVKHENWSMDQWRKVVFSDESKFNLFNSDGMNRIRRPVWKKIESQVHSANGKAR